MIRLLAWLVFGLSPEIKEQQKAIAANSRDIEGIKPIADEAAKRADDVYYKKRSIVDKSRRRVARAEMVLLNDLNQGWRGDLNG